jgi:hypothetical protein
MTSPAQHGNPANPRPSGEDTLRLIAGLPAPEGLKDRVHARLRTAPPTSSLLHWPFAPLMDYRIHSPAFRTAAAAAIVCVVAGGGWQIFSHVQTAPEPNAIVQPARVGNGGGFSNAGAMRTPDTLDRPVLKHPLPSKQQDSTAPAPAAPAKKHKPSKHKANAAPDPR